jgi:hypothetical protein
MGLVIFLRKRLLVNRFRDILVDSINLGVGDNAVICSGFFQEFFHNSPYQASTERNLSNVLVTRAVQLTTIGIHNYNWFTSYKNFRNNLRGAGVNISAKYMPGFHWHAKIYVLKRKDDPLLAIIGSSNITRSAFSTIKPFNYEADVIMWLDTITQITNLIEGIIAETRDDPHEIIIADYDPHKNSDLTIEDRLKRIDADIKGLTLRDLPE